MQTCSDVGLREALAATRVAGIIFMSNSYLGVKKGLGPRAKSGKLAVCTRIKQGLISVLCLAFLAHLVCTLVECCCAAEVHCNIYLSWPWKSRCSCQAAQKGRSAAMPSAHEVRGLFRAFLREGALPAASLLLSTVYARLLELTRVLPCRRKVSQLQHQRVRAWA